MDETAEMKHNALRFVTLAEYGGVCMLESRKLFLVTLPFALELFGNLLLKDKCFQCIVSLFFCAREAYSEPRGIVFVLFNEGCKASVFAFVGFDFDLKILSFFCKLFGKCLEFEELATSVCKRRSKS